MNASDVYVNTSDELCFESINSFRSILDLVIARKTESMQNELERIQLVAFNALYYLAEVFEKTYKHPKSVAEFRFAINGWMTTKHAYYLICRGTIKCDEEALRVIRSLRDVCFIL